jgi:hypothetical protein
MSPRGVTIKMKGNIMRASHATTPTAPIDEKPRSMSLRPRSSSGSMQAGGSSGDAPGWD